MDSNLDVHCLRIPLYDFNNKAEFDPDFTPKSINPDAVRHFNTVTNKRVEWSGPTIIGGKTFYHNNWHYTSRPTLWRTDVLMSLFEGVDEDTINRVCELLILNPHNNKYIVINIGTKITKCTMPTPH